MSVHVLRCYPLILCLGLTRGKHKMDKELTTVTISNRINEPFITCDKKCSTKGDSTGSCLVHTLKDEDADAILNSERVKVYKVPNPPDEVSMTFQDDTGKLKISVKSGRSGKYVEPLAFVLIELKSEPHRHEQYILLEINITGTHKGYMPYSFNCKETHSDIKKINMAVWTLGQDKVLGKNIRAKTFSFNPGTIDFLGPGFYWDPQTIVCTWPCDNGFFGIICGCFMNDLKKKKMIDDCVCSSKVQSIRLYQNGTVIHGFVNVTNVHREGELKILLLHRSTNGSITEQRTWQRYGNGSYTIFRFTENRLNPGNYSIKVKRDCRGGPNIRTNCGRENPLDVVSKDLEIKPSDVTVMSDREKASQLFNSRAPQKTSTRTEDTAKDLVFILEIAVILASAFASTMILVALFIKFACGGVVDEEQSGLQRHLESAEYLIPATSDADRELESQEEQHFFTIHHIEDGLVPLIYTEDTITHKESVYKLREQLAKYGVKILIVDNENCPEIRSNWIDFAEMLARTYKTFLFVVSPLLVSLCHEGKHGSETSFQCMVGKTKGMHIPLTLLRNFEALRAKNNQKSRICLVELTKHKTKRTRLSCAQCLKVEVESEQVTADEVETVEGDSYGENTEPFPETIPKDNLSKRLLHDYMILSDTKGFKIPIADLVEDEDLTSSHRVLLRLTRWLKCQHNR